MKIGSVIDYLNELAPPSLQEGYDNCGLIVGAKEWKCTGVLTCLDSTEDVVSEAIEKGCNLIVAHHPIIFAGLKKITGKNYVERTIIKAIKNDIAIFAIHTNLDNVKHGVNGVFAKALQLKNQKILAPKSSTLSKIVFYVPPSHKDAVLTKMYQAGAGKIGNYEECSFTIEGEGTFRPGADANPYQGVVGELEKSKENRVELLMPNYTVRKVIEAMQETHPYEEVAYDLYELKNTNQDIGAGMIGFLEQPKDKIEWLKEIKGIMNCKTIRYTDAKLETIRKVAICGGSGSFLLQEAKRQGADVFVTGDFKYHEFFDGENEIIIADIGHYESEHLTINYLASCIKEKFTTFAVLLTTVNTNPIKYL